MRVAIVMLACSDYEAMELALACHAAHLPAETPLFILQNCRGTYDSERTLMAARRFARLHPGRVEVVEDIPPAPPYRSLATLLASERLAPFDLICKVDDDAFPIAPGWLERLLAAYDTAARDPRPLAYTTPLINNNTWGFGATLDALGLREAYSREAAIRHVVGAGNAIAPHRVVEPDEIVGGTNGTIWGYPHIARWLHERTTLDPDRLLAATAALPDCDVPSEERYSIGCILFRRTLWPEIDDGGSDDEHMFHQHCRRTGARIVCAQSVPFVHLAYFSQREENRDLVPRARALYEQRLGLRWPIALRASRELEIEARLRYLEGQGVFSAGVGGSGGIGALGGLTPEQFAWRAIRGLWREGLRRLGLKRR
jgi:hypothetical protein